MLFRRVGKQKQFETNEDCRERSGVDSITRIKISRNCNFEVLLHEVWKAHNRLSAERQLRVI